MESSIGRSVCGSVRLGQQERLFGSFGLSPVGFPVHLLVRAFASAFPGHSAGHDERQVPTPRVRGRGSESRPGWPQHSSHTPKWSPEGNWVPNVPWGKATRGSRWDRMAPRQQAIKAPALTQNKKNRQDIGTEEKGERPENRWSRLLPNANLLSNSVRHTRSHEVQE